MKLDYDLDILRQYIEESKDSDGIKYTVAELLRLIKTGDRHIISDLQMLIDVRDAKFNKARHYR